ncbi:MAG: proline--tRNA ligase [Halobacteria archaeon]
MGDKKPKPQEKRAGPAAPVEAPLDKSNFPEWWQEILKRTGIVDVRYPVKGLTVWPPFGAALRRRVLDLLRRLLDEEHQEVLFPLLIPADVLGKESQHIKGFEREVYWVTKGGSEELEVPLALRPTSETAMYPLFKLWIRSHADLPLRVYQIVNVFRHETKHTRPLIRVREITTFKEAHTVHATAAEAAAQVEYAKKMYQRFFDALGVPVLVSRRPEWDKFPGAETSWAFDAVMPDGRTLQVGTIHNLGQNFAKTFDLTYEDAKGGHVHAFQTCYGISERAIAATVAVHGDDRGLVLPPDVAPVQVAVVPIQYGEQPEVRKAAEAVRDRLRNAGLRVALDLSDERPGAKFYRWEFRGVPLRVEIGAKEVAAGELTLVRRDAGTKERVASKEVVAEVGKRLESVGASLLEKARAALKPPRVRRCDTLEQLKLLSKSEGVVTIPWCGTRECAERLEAETAALLDQKASLLGELPPAGKMPCAACGSPAKAEALIGRAY